MHGPKLMAMADLGKGGALWMSVGCAGVCWEAAEEVTASRILNIGYEGEE